MEFYTLASSSAGNAALVCHNDTHLLIDAGISCRRITQSPACGSTWPCAPQARTPR